MTGPIKLFFFLFCSLWAGKNYLYAQKQGKVAIDSMLLELSKQKEDTNKVMLLNNLSFGYSNINPDEGNVYYLQKDYSKALEYYFKALKMHEEHADKIAMADVMGNIGNIYSDQNSYSNALEYYF